MSKNLTLRTSAQASSTTFTETKGNVVIQPREIPTETAESAVDLDATAIERSCSLVLAWNEPSKGSRTSQQLNVTIEGAAATGGPWQTIARFDAVDVERVPVGSQTIAFVSGYQFIRARWTLTPPSQAVKGSATFGVTGVAS